MDHTCIHFTEDSFSKSFPDTPLNNKSLYLLGDGDFCGIGIEKILPLSNMGDATPPAEESKPFLLKIILLIDQWYDFKVDFFIYNIINMSGLWIRIFQAFSSIRIRILGTFQPKIIFNFTYYTTS